MARVDLRDNEFMEQFVSQNHIDSNDVQFWYQLLSCSFNFMRVQDPRVVDKTLDPYLVRLVLNNSESANVGSLLRVFLDRVSRIKSPSGKSTNPYYVFQSFNALYLIRSICKSYIESLSEEQLVKAFRAKVDQPAPAQIPSQTPLPPVPQQQYQKQQTAPLEAPPVQHQPILSNGSSDPTNKHLEQSLPSPLPPMQSNVVVENQQQSIQPPPIELASDNPIQVQDQAHESNKKAEFTGGTAMLDQYISTLIAIIVDIPLTESTYLLQVEAINGLLVLLSVQMYSTTPANQSIIYRSLMQKKCSIHALILTKTLLNNFVNQQPMPQESGSIIIGLASGLWKVLTLGYGSQEDEEEESMPLLARQSLLILNILTNHYTSEKNPYREAMVSCQDSRYNLSDPQTAIDNANNDALATATTSKSILISNSIKIDFHKLYETICKYLNNDQVALLLYLLLHSNKIFRLYILTTASKELDRLVLPLLRILYSSIEKGSHHVYMVLILFIILSEEHEFNTSIHQIIVRSVPWYKDRVLSEISLGSLTALIIIRSFQYNTFRIKDKFLHTNLFATLANLSNHFHNLHPYVCQRLVDLLERLTKRYLLLTRSDQLDSKQLLPPGKQMNLNLLNENMDPLAKALATDTHKQDLQDASSIELDSSNISMMNNNDTEFLAKQNGCINISIPQQAAPATGNDIGGSGGVMMEQSSMVATNDSMMQQHQQQQQQVDVAGGSSGQQSPKSQQSHSTDHINISMDDGRQDVGLIEEVIRMILEVINNSLAVQLKSNPDLIYTLLYKRTVFNSLLSSHQSFYNMVINVERIITFFYNRIETNGEGQLTVEEVKELIRTTSNEWQEFDLQQQQVLVDGSKGGPKELNTTSRLLFHYVEDEQPEDFFIPYIWTRIYYSSGIVWNSKRIVLFNPDDL